MLELYKNIKARREALGMSQETLAKLVGYSDRSSIAKIESGKVDLPQTKILEIAKALKIPAGELMGLDGIVPPEPIGRVGSAPPHKTASGDGKDIKEEYYLDPKAARMAQEVFTRPEMQIMFDASRNLSKEDIEMVTALIEKLSGK